MPCVLCSKQIKKGGTAAPPINQPIMKTYDAASIANLMFAKVSTNHAVG